MPTKIRTGITDGVNIEVTEGLKAGDKVVVEGIQKARDGAQVTAKEWTPPKDALVSKSDQTK